MEKIPVLDLKPGYDALKTQFATAINRVVESGQFIMGPDVQAFEHELAEYLGVKHVVSLNSGTDALVIGLRALGVAHGDEVITTPFTFFATAEAISQLGAVPVFCDVEEGTFNIDVTKIADLITPRTRAILPVHLYGRPSSIDAIMEIAARHNLKVLEDCAQSFGASSGGRQTGAIGNAGAFSFFPSKTLGAFGDGGCLATNDDAVAQLARSLRAHGSLKKYHNEIIGYNSRLDTLQAAILRVKLPHIDNNNAARRAVAGKYNEMLGGVPGLVVPEILGGHVFHQYTVRLTAVDRDRVQNQLGLLGISSMVYYPVPLHKLPVYRDTKATFPVSEKFARQVLSLPIWPELAESTVGTVVNALKRVLSDV